MPFHGSNNDEIFEKIRVADYTFPSPYFDHISIEGRIAPQRSSNLFFLALDFIDKILVPNLKQRMTLDQCLEHVWMRKWHPDLQKKWLESQAQTAAEKRSKKRRSSRREEVCPFFTFGF
jgi:serine/threonine protein kinase